MKDSLRGFSKVHITGCMFDLIGLGWDVELKFLTGFPGDFDDILHELLFQDIILGTDFLKFCLKGKEDLYSPWC